MSDYLGKDTFKLGFGLMRLPKNPDGTIDIPQTAKMADAFIAAGGTYFDTAYVYDEGASEAAFKAAVADRFSVLFYGEDFAYSGTLMAPLAFTLIMIGFANVIRTQWVLPQGRDSIFVRSVCAGAAVNLIVNLLLIPGMKSMGAVIGTLMAEMTVPVVQYLLLRKELPYCRFLGYTGIYAGIGLVMLVCVRLTGRLLPWTGWAGLAVQVAVGMIVYGLLCLPVWKKQGLLRKGILPGRGRKK